MKWCNIQNEIDLQFEIETWFDIFEAGQISESELYEALIEKGITSDDIEKLFNKEKAERMRAFCKERGIQ